MSSGLIVFGGTRPRTLRLTLREEPGTAAARIPLYERWFDIDVEIIAPPFRGRFSTSAHGGELNGFREKLLGLYQEPNGTTCLELMDQSLKIELSGDGRGNYKGEVFACQYPAHGVDLRFELEIDQTELPPIIEALPGA